MGKGGGGHGGLNILPQKSWNVYGYENRAKVKEDEEKFAEEQRLKESAEIQARRDARRHELLERARSGRSNSEENEAPTSTTHVHLFEKEEEAAALEEIARSRDHAKAHNRDNIDKFWKLGYGCAPSTEGVLPWYAQESTSEVHNERDTNGTRTNPNRIEQSTQEVQKLLKHTDEKERKHKHKIKHHKEKKHHKSHRDKKKRRHSSDEDRSPKRAKKSIEQLRQERLQRENQEQGRQIGVVAQVFAAHTTQNLRGKGSAADTSKYNSGYGNAPSRRR
mmetsp:Transcript_3120/g.6500  ORF Transcript_3120/g.6500 Transcript_3120/m.6500 type:complete len:277 (+) Transcript_3120:203-1033(+)|eukprot:CAMPEP_0118923494 /NCGR_PEP_ID=MMETSP1169-20130426/1995_1 /TAXON_ID=36882 /ORGANISM="Pyramimonas obovata, Strain CCMP722" /LENGTH=276 /DNA_ID=CAMNT_0006864481 /DNA_START=183 /DNA_END=1016 /DNA_ORIENTATION=+